jgi:hypothetical protein
MWDPDTEYALARGTLARWSGFPVRELPRPPVLTEPAVSFGGGFSSSTAKRDFQHGPIEAEPGVPRQALQALADRRWPGTADTRAVGRPLRVLAAQKDTAIFATDRGPRRLPIWRIEIDGAEKPLQVLDPAIRHYGPGPPGDDEAHLPAASARLGRDGRDVTFAFIGDPEQYAHYPQAAVLHTETAVTVVPVAVDTGHLVRTTHAQWRQVTVRLDAPLGARVLVAYRTGCPVPTASGREPGCAGAQSADDNHPQAG